MHVKLIEDAAERTYALIFDEGDKVMEHLKAFAQEENLTAAYFTAIGAFREVTLGFFDPDRKEYEKTRLDEQVEVLTLAGNVAMREDRPAVHAHVVVGKRDGSAHGGHLMEAIVRPTLEVMLVETPHYLRRTHDEKTGLALINTEA